MKTIRVGVTGVGSLLGQGIVRSLQWSSTPITIIGLCVDKLATGLYWCDEAKFIPFAKDESYIDGLIAAVKESQIDLLLIGTDVELHKVSAHRSLIERETGALVLISDPFVVDLGDDKYKTAKFFSDKSLPSPMSAIPDNETELDSLVSTYGFPLIVKPRKGMRSYGVVKVQGMDELTDVIKRTADPVVQECVGSSDEEYTASGLYFDGECKAAIVMRRDLRDGNTYRAFTVNNDVLTDVVKKWTELVKPFGPINFQFRIDVNGNPKVFEINSRFSGTTPLRARAGFNEVDMCLRYLMHAEEITQPKIREIMILRHWEETVVEFDESPLGGHQVK